MVGTRCLNDAQFVPLFLANHPFADKIVICDGGSDDASVGLALRDPRVEVVHFPVKVVGKHGGWRNPEGEHVNATLDAIEAHNPDWVWLTEMDAIPNRAFQERAQALFDNALEQGTDLVSTYLLYVGPDGRSHYPELMLGPGYTAWRKGLGRATNLSDPFEGQGALHIAAGSPLNLDPPLARIHFTFYTEAHIAAKAAWYRQVHGLDQPHPDERCGPREPLPDWAVWRDPDTGEWARSI